MPGRPAEDAAHDLLERHLARHAEWVIFRRSMHALVAIDPDVRAFQLRVRATQISRMEKLLQRYGAPILPRAQLLYSFLCVERALNAVTDDDLRALKVSRPLFAAKIADELVFLLTGQRG